MKNNDNVRGISEYRKTSASGKPASREQPKDLETAVLELNDHNLGQFLIEYCLGPGFQNLEKILNLLKKAGLNDDEQKVFIGNIIQDKEISEVALELGYKSAGPTENRRRWGIAKLLDFARKLLKENKDIPS